MKKITSNFKMLLTMLLMAVCAGAWAKDVTGTIKFGTDAVKINAASVTGNDDLGNTWTITTVGTSSYTANAAYYQVGSSKAPATSITFTTTLPNEVTITSMSAKFGGFSGTVGDVNLKVGSTSIGTGNLNAANDVTVSSTGSADGNVLTVSVTGIDKGVKCYNISYTYTEGGGDDPTPTTYTVTVADNIANGTVTASTTSAAKDATVTLTATPADGYEFGSWDVTNASTSAAITVTDNKFTMPAANVNVSATFNKTQGGGDEPSGDGITVSMTSFSAISGKVGGDPNVSYEAEKGSASTAPAVNSNQIRVYQNGGLFTVTAAEGYKLKSVTIGSAMATSINYKLDGGSEALASNASISASGTYTASNLDNTSIQFICKGTTSSSRLYVNSLSVTYAKEGGDTPSSVTAPEITVEDTPAFGATTATISVGSDAVGFYYTTDGTDPEESSTAIDVEGTSKTIDITETTTIRAIAYDSEMNLSNETKKTVEILSVINGLSALKEAARATSLYVSLTNAVVTLVNGSNAFMEDANGGVLVYKSGHGLSVGDCLNGVYKVTTSTYNGKFEITSLEAITGVKTTGAEIPCTTLTLEEFTEDGACDLYESMRVKIENVNVTKGIATGARQGEIADDDENSAILYAGVNGITAEEGSNITVIGYPTFQNETTEFAVWDQKDITVNSVPEKELTSITLTGTDNIEFTIGDEFNHDGVVVTANYDNGSTEIVTESATFSTPDMSTVGSKTVTVTYEGKTATYDIAVNEPSDEVTVTWEASKQGYTNSQKITSSIADEVISFEFDKAAGSTDPAYYTTGTGLRLYGNNIMTVKAVEGYVITAIAMTFSGTGYTGGYKANVGTYTNGQNSTWSGCAPVIEFRATSTSRMQKVTVTYEPLTELGEVTVGAAGYGTYCAPKDVIIGDGTVAKYITGISENGATLVEKDAPVVAEGEGVLLVGEGTHKIYSHNDLTATANSNNKLVGVDENTPAPVGSYVLQNLSGVVGFYQVEAGEQPTVKAGRAYLDLGAEAGAKAFTFGDDNETAISSIKTVATDEVIYNLAGQRVQKMQKGINIVNGKKVLF